jgi:hypothetical protein
MATRLGAAHCSSRVLDDDDAIGGLRHFGQQRIGQRGLAGRGAAGDEDVGAGRDALAQRLGLGGRHDPGRDVIVEREHRDGGLADGEGRGRDHGRQQALEPLPVSGSSAETRGAPAWTSAPT